MANRHYIPARPRTIDAIRTLPCHPSIKDAAALRGISQVVHFTTVQGAIGVIATSAVESRMRLNREQYLEHIYKPNTSLRKDQEWLDYVNLSIERINDWMFEASERWHSSEALSWVVLSFRPEILSHRGVVFTTTNNIYPACLRQEGKGGFLRMFAEHVKGRYSISQDRRNKVLAWTTDRQAEVLYPGELSCAYLQRIDVQQEHSLDVIAGVLSVFKRDVPIRHSPEVFR